MDKLIKILLQSNHTSVSGKLFYKSYTYVAVELEGLLVFCCININSTHFPQHTGLIFGHCEYLYIHSLVFWLSIHYLSQWCGTRWSCFM